MLDLNVSVEKFVENSIQMDESGTSNSSIIVNAATTADDDSCSTRAFTFDILKLSHNNYNNNSIIKNKDSSENQKTNLKLVTRELFPASGDEVGELTLGQICHFASVGGLQVHDDEMRMVKQQVKKKMKRRRGPRSRSSQFRGVTFYRRTGRWESHIWDCGKQVYLGGFDTAHAAARAYDRAALKFRGVDADINFNFNDYEEDMKHTTNLSKEEFVLILRRQSTGFSRGTSKYRGVTLHKCGRWEARMGQFLGKKAYDKAAINCNGKEAVTNFELSSYGEIISEAHNGGAVTGSQHNLDLNLRISSPNFGDERKDNGSLGCFQFHPCDMNHTRRSKGSATQKRIQLGSSQKPANWDWQMHGQVNPKPTALFSTAASSGFSSAVTTTTLTASTYQSIASPNPTTLNLCFASSAPAAANTSQYHYQLRHPPSPS